MDRFEINGSGRMKLSEMRNKVTGLPDGFAGTKKDWKDVAETFRIEKAAILEKDKKDESGEDILYRQVPKQGQPVPRQADSDADPHRIRRGRPREDKLA